MGEGAESKGSAVWISAHLRATAQEQEERGINNGNMRSVAGAPGPAAPRGTALRTEGFACPSIHESLRATGIPSIGGDRASQAGGHGAPALAAQSTR